MVVLQQLAMLTTIDVRAPRHRRSPAVTRSAAQDRLGRANELRLNTTAVGTLAGVGGAGTVSLAQHAGTMPSWQTLTISMVTLALAAYLAPRLWRFMNAR